MENKAKENSNKFGIVGAILIPLFSTLIIGLLIYFNLTTKSVLANGGEYIWVAFLPIIMFYMMIFVFIIFSTVASAGGIGYSLFQLKNKDIAYRPAYYFCLIYSILIGVTVILNIVYIFAPFVINI